MFEELHARYPDCIMLFQLDGFLFAFGEDANVVADVCGIYMHNNAELGCTTSFSRQTAPKIINDLLGAGLKVAIADRQPAWQNLN
jgi:DNA mismatch repair ATPase MutS